LCQFPFTEYLNSQTSPRYHACPSVWCVTGMRFLPRPRGPASRARSASACRLICLRMATGPLTWTSSSLTSSSTFWCCWWPPLLDRLQEVGLPRQSDPKSGCRLAVGTCRCLKRDGGVCRPRCCLYLDARLNEALFVVFHFLLNRVYFDSAGKRWDNVDDSAAVRWKKCRRRHEFTVQINTRTKDQVEAAALVFEHRRSFCRDVRSHGLCLCYWTTSANQMGVSQNVSQLYRLILQQQMVTMEVIFSFNFHGFAQEKLPSSIMTYKECTRDLSIVNM